MSPDPAIAARINDALANLSRIIEERDAKKAKAVSIAQITATYVEFDDAEGGHHKIQIEAGGDVMKAFHDALNGGFLNVKITSDVLMSAAARANHEDALFTDRLLSNLQFNAMHPLHSSAVKTALTDIARHCGRKDFADYLNARM